MARTRLLLPVLAAALMASASTPDPGPGPSEETIPTLAMAADWYATTGEADGLCAVGRQGAYFRARNALDAESTLKPTGHSTSFWCQQAMAFQDYMANSDTCLPTTGPFYMDANFYFTHTSTTFALFGEFYPNPRWRVTFNSNTGDLLFDVYEGGVWTNKISHTAGSAHSTWWHVALSRDSSDVVRLFLDGTSVGSATVTLPAIDTGVTPLYFAGTQINGQIINWTNFRYWNDYCLHDANFTPPSAVIDLDYPDADGDALWDEVIFLCDCDNQGISGGPRAWARNGLLKNASSNGGLTPGHFSRTYAAGADNTFSSPTVWNGQLAGSVDNSIFRPGTKSVTVECHVKTPANSSSSGGGNRGLLNNGTSSMPWAMYLARVATTPTFALRAIVSSDGTVSDGVTSRQLDSGTLAQDTWYHVAFSYDTDTGTTRLFVDGVLVDSSTDAFLVGGLYNASTNNIQIGGPSTVADIRINDCRVTTALRYDADFTPPSARFPYYPLAA